MCYEKFAANQERINIVNRRIPIKRTRGKIVIFYMITRSPHSPSFFTDRNTSILTKTALHNIEQLIAIC